MAQGNQLKVEGKFISYRHKNKTVNFEKDVVRKVEAGGKAEYAALMESDIASLEKQGINLEGRIKAWQDRLNDESDTSLTADDKVKIVAHVQALKDYLENHPERVAA